MIGQIIRQSERKGTTKDGKKWVRVEQTIIGTDCLAEVEITDFAEAAGVGEVAEYVCELSAWNSGEQLRAVGLIANV